MTCEAGNTWNCGEANTLWRMPPKPSPIPAKVQFRGSRTQQVLQGSPKDEVGPAKLLFPVVRSTKFVNGLGPKFEKNSARDRPAIPSGQSHKTFPVPQDVIVNRRKKLKGLGRCAMFLGPNPAMQLVIGLQ